MARKTRKALKALKALKKQQRMLQAAMAANGGAMGTGQGQGFLGGLAGLLPSRGSDRFLIGVLVGAAAAYVLSDEELRGRIMKSGLKLYAGLAGGLAEMKEQAADLQAELEAEQAGAS